MIGLTDGIFHKTSPILFRKSNDPITLENNKVNLKILYTSPCLIFKVRIKDHPDLHHWCETSMWNSFERPFMKFCDFDSVNHSTQKVNTFSYSNDVIRKKRFAPVVIAVAGLIAGALATTVGVSTAALVKVGKLGERLDEDERILQALLEKVELISLNQLSEKKAFYSLEQSMEVIQKELFTLGTAFDYMKSYLPEAIYSVADLASRFALTKDMIMDIEHDWKRNRMNKRLEHLFNITFPKNTELERGKPSRCKIDIAKKRLYINFTIPTISEESYFMLVDPFNLYRDNETHVQKLEYTGTKYVLYNSTSHCAQQLPGLREPQNGNIIFLPHISCDRETVSMKIDWKVKNTEKRYLFIPESTLQIKYTNSETYIYCYLNKIKFFNKTTKDCPPSSFYIPNNIPFSINNH